MCPINDVITTLYKLIWGGGEGLYKLILQKNIGSIICNCFTGTNQMTPNAINVSILVTYHNITNIILSL